MIDEINSFTTYLQEVKHTAKNTEVSYHRDLVQMAGFNGENGDHPCGEGDKDQFKFLHPLSGKRRKSSIHLSRELASIKAFFNYLFKERKINRDPAEFLRAPKIERRIPVILTKEEIQALLAQPGNASVKEMRDKAMLELLYATGVRVSELISLKLEDVNMQIGYITCHDGTRERMIPFGKGAKQALRVYLDEARSSLLKGRTCEWLFTNCSGQPMSRQGFWKLIKFYGEKAGIKTDITPHTLRHSFAAHLIRGGADIHAVQAMLGHSDSTTTHMYAPIPAIRWEKPTGRLCPENRKMRY